MFEKMLASAAEGKKRLLDAATSGDSSELLSLLKNVTELSSRLEKPMCRLKNKLSGTTDPFHITHEDGEYENCGLLELALINGKIENAECLFENVKEFQKDESLSVSFYHVITKAPPENLDSALNWLLKKSKDPNESHGDYCCRPVHTAIQLKKQEALSVLLKDPRFDLSLTGNIAYLTVNKVSLDEELLTPLQLALVYDNEEAAIQLLGMPNGLEILCARSNTDYEGERVERLNAIKFAAKIGKINTLREYIWECALSRPKSDQDSNDLMWFARIFMSGDGKSPDSENKGKSPDSENGSCFFKCT